MLNGINNFDFLRIISLDSAFQVSQQTVSIIERFGKFTKIADAGINFKIPFIDQIVTTQSLRIQQLDVRVSTKTKDNVFVDVVVSAQYRILDDKNQIYKSYYELEDVQEQINSYLFDVVRAEVPKMKLDEVFEKKDEIANAIKIELGEAIDGFGYEIVKTLVTDIDVDDRIIQAMNEIVASEREKLAAIEKAEAEKILMVKRAEAEAESKKLQGEGIANQRIAIINGFKESIDEMKKIEGIQSTEILNLILITQYFDTLKDVAASDSNTIMMPNSPSNFSEIGTQIREAIISGNLVSKKD
ncbi:SPFH domain-containing protein [Halarcobacter bivalviorum]|uniref:SPFH domain-containing protein n=1 Tax=Halarcobacter bivalviorum TaxID=663364 RepID=UPI00100B8833|nr:SPFH domain-containing protein [Halarcobacter bivalviorum]RXK06062.1 SPFH domain-containing protein [Halarcobacter bivalviorum]